MAHERSEMSNTSMRSLENSNVESGILEDGRSNVSGLASQMSLSSVFTSPGRGHGSGSGQFLTSSPIHVFEDNQRVVSVKNLPEKLRNCNRYMESIEPNS